MLFLKDQIPSLRAKNYKRIIKEVKNTSNNIFKQYLLGHIYFQQKDYNKALSFFLKAGGIKNVEKNDQKSSLYLESLYYIIQIYAKKTDISLALKYANLNSKLSNHYLFYKILLLKLDLLRKAKLYSNILDILQNLKEQAIPKKYKPIYYNYIANAYYKLNKKRKAINYFFKALEYPENDAAYIESTKKIKSIFKHNSYLLKKIKLFQKLRYAEGLRIIQNNNAALKLYKRIVFKNLSPKYRYYYIQNYIRYLIQTKQIKKAVTLFHQYKNMLPFLEKKKLYNKVTKRLFKSKYYYTVLKIVPKFSGIQNANLLRIRSLYELEKDASQEAAYYLKNFDKDSTLTERAFFYSCFKYMKYKNLKPVACLKRLAQKTNTVSTGGRARYYLGKIYSQLNKKNQAVEYYKDVYLNSPSNYFAFKALNIINSKRNNISSLPENNIESIQNWIIANYKNKHLLKKYFDRKKQDSTYGVDDFWVEWENLLNDTTLSNESTIKFIFFTMLSNSFSWMYRPKLSRIKYSLLMQKIGEFFNDSNLKYRYLKIYLTAHKKSVDIFTLSKKAVDFLYPMPYLDYTQKICKQYGISIAKIYSLMKQESAFHNGARSWANAQGIMQIMPATSRWLNKKLKIPRLNLLNPQHSILLGAKFYSDLQNQYRNNHIKMAIAYNAGPGRLRKWTREIKEKDIDFFVEKIPFKETRLYVKITKVYLDRYHILWKNFIQ